MRARTAFTQGPIVTVGVILLLVAIGLAVAPPRVRELTLIVLEEPAFGALVLGPTILVLALGYLLWRHGRTEPRVIWKAAVHGAAAASMAITLFTMYIMYAIAVSERSTAFVSIVEIPLNGLPLAAVVFLVTWISSISAASLRSYLSRGRPA